MRGDLLGVGARVAQKFGGTRVGAGAARLRQVGVDGLAHERVHEGERHAALQHRGAGQRVGSARRRVGVDARQRRRALQRSSVAEHGHGRGQLRRRARQRGDAADDRLGHRLGDHPPPVGAAARPRARAGRTGCRPSPRRRPPQSSSSPPSSACTIRATAPALSGRAPPRLRAGGARSAARASLSGRPRRHHHGDRQLVEPLQQVEQELQRGLVRPVRVVDREQQRAAARRRWPPASAARAGAGTRSPACPAREQRRRQRRGAGQQLGAAGQRREQLQHDAEAEVALEVRAAGAQDGHAVRRLAGGRRQARLAEPRLALHDQAPPLAAPRGGQHRGDGLELLAPLQQLVGKSQGPTPDDEYPARATESSRCLTRTSSRKAALR